MGNFFENEQKEFLGITQDAGIGEMVDKRTIDIFNTYLYLYGQEHFFKAIFDGEGSSVAYAYLHPCEEMRATKGFSTIQQAFMNAYI